MAFRHGYSAYINHHCRCKKCTEEHTLKMREYREAHPELKDRARQREALKRARMRGNLNKLQKCEYCEMFTDVMRKHLIISHGWLPDHGDLYRYRSGCRCPECRGASAKYRAKLRARGR